MTREQYEMLQWLPKGQQAAMLQQQNAQFADGNAADLSAIRAATNAGVGSVFDQEQNGTFDAVSDPNSETVKSETTTTNADGTKTTTTTSNPNNSPSARLAEDAKNPDQIRVTTQDGRFSAMIDPSMLEQYSAAGYKPGPQTATPNGGTVTTPTSEFDQSTLGLARGGGGRAVIDSQPQKVPYTNAEGLVIHAVPGSVEAQYAEANMYTQGGVGQASLVQPGVTGTPVLDTQAQAQQGIINSAGEQAAADALIANEGLGNSAITNQQAQDDARNAAEASAASDFSAAVGTQQAVIDQASPVDQVAAEANAFQQAEGNWADQDAADTASFLEEGRDEFQTIDDQVSWATDEFNFDNNIKDAFSDDELSAIEKDNEEGGFFSNILETMTGISPEDIDGWLEGAKEWYKDNPAMVAALGTAAANYVATGSPYQSIGKGIEAGFGNLSDQATAKAAAAKEQRANDEFDRRANNQMKRDMIKEAAKAGNKAQADAILADDKTAKEWGTWTNSLGANQKSLWSDKERTEYGIADETNVIRQAALSFQKDYELQPDWFNDPVMKTTFGAGIAEWNDFNHAMVNNGTPEKITKSPLTFIEDRFTKKNSNLSSAVFGISSKEDVADAGQIAWRQVGKPGSNGTKMSIQDSWAALNDRFTKLYVTNGIVDKALADEAEAAGMSPLIFWIKTKV